MKIQKPHAVLVASPGMGHLIPVLELGKRFVSQHDFQVTVFAASTEASTVQSHLQNSPEYTNNNLFKVVSLPSVDTSASVDTDATVATKIIVMMHESLPALRSAISAMKPRPTAMIVDLFGTEAMAMADEFGMLKYMFIASNAWFLAAMIYAPALDEKGLDEHANQKLPMKIPGCTAVRFDDTLEPFLNANDPMFQGFLLACMAMSTADGILVNTWEDLEPKTLAAFRDTKLLGRVAKAPVYPIGPLARPVGPVGPPVLRSHVLDWLDTKPTESVIYVSFGSGGSLSAKQMIELAWGLELSQQRFVWVVRPPIENDVSESYLTVGKDSNGVHDYLPEGFLSRTHCIGLVIPMWAPQAEILGHPSVGGFLSHCGWNSTLESIVNGVPMIGWPLFAEQKMNATLLTEEIGVAVRCNPAAADGMLVGREEIKTMVRRVTVEKQGHAMRSRVKEAKCSAEKALSRGGSSYNSLTHVVEECETGLQGLIAKSHGS
ncbi:hypothetical protein JRO89_XS08G0163900 [Xanthoceras sorbifolium]|uniref:Glycosyltransferase n=1 Tax=Xanthoceras sorbifolium TaxID=99658 RepID=A0ABQ8HQ24_9ROSI|nr:hypothetical protein JRO89_XS08G0163900 [Xanthoceras sorbifolium]